MAAMNLDAGLLYDLGRFAEAKRLQQELVDIERRTLKPRDLALGSLLDNPALDLASGGRYAEAEKSSRESLAILGGSLGREHPATLATMTNLSRLLRDEGK